MSAFWAGRRKQPRGRVQIPLPWRGNKQTPKPSGLRQSQLYQEAERFFRSWPARLISDGLPCVSAVNWRVGWKLDGLIQRSGEWHAVGQSNGSARATCFSSFVRLALASSHGCLRFPRTAREGKLHCEVTFLSWFASCLLLYTGQSKSQRKPSQGVEKQP